MHDHRNLPRIKRPLSDFAESAYQIQMILHPIHVIMMTIRKGKSMATSEESQFINELKPFLRQAMWYDVRKCLDKDLKYIQTNLVREFQMTQQRNTTQTVSQVPAAQLAQNIMQEA